MKSACGEVVHTATHLLLVSCADTSRSVQKAQHHTATQLPHALRHRAGGGRSDTQGHGARQQGGRVLLALPPKGSAAEPPCPHPAAHAPSVMVLVQVWCTGGEAVAGTRGSRCQCERTVLQAGSEWESNGAARGATQHSATASAVPRSREWSHTCFAKRAGV